MFPPSRPHDTRKDHQAMTANDRSTLARLLSDAQHRAERAHYYGDRAGELIAQGDARRLLRQLINASAVR